MPRYLGTTAVLVASGALTLAGCGSSGGGGAYVQPTGPPVKSVTITGDHFKFAPSTITVPPGIVQFTLKSQDIGHSFVIEGIPGFQIEADSGSSGTGKVKLKKGKYTFYCNVPGHRAAGMQGTLTVG
ncbi:MAG: plastocyanin/azurin family copper-binding protein [Acidimicrobiia bacterium]